jgi:hypothetical protein
MSMDRLPTTSFHGRIPDAPDNRDFHLDRKKSPVAKALSAYLHRARAQPTRGRPFLLRENLFGPVKNQATLNDCCACAATGLIEYLARRDRGLDRLECSPAFLYKVTRTLMGTSGNSPTDSRTTMRALTMVGVAEEKTFPTIEENLDREPSSLEYALAANLKATEYWRLDVDGVAPQELLQKVKETLLGDVPLMFSLHLKTDEGIQAFAKRTAATGEIPLPEPAAIEAFLVRRRLDAELARQRGHGEAVDRARALAGAAAQPIELSPSARAQDTLARLLNHLPGRTPADQTAGGQALSAQAPAIPPVVPFVGHCLVACGFDDDKRRLRVRNSWSKDWGEGGYGWISYDFISRGLTEDWWFVSNASLVDTSLFNPQAAQGPAA